jgi:hypothetical protein
MDILSAQKPASSTVQFTESAPMDDGLMKDLVEKVGGLRKDLDRLRDEFAKWVKEMQDSLNGKADIEALTNLERIIMDRLSELIKALTKQFADKNETKKALKLLERQLKNLYDLFMSKGGVNENEDDAMFTKKPLGGMSCASCEKDIINLQGRKADYLPWGKFPFRDPSERIARVSVLNSEIQFRSDKGSRRCCR